MSSSNNQSEYTNVLVTITTSSSDWLERIKQLGFKNFSWLYPTQTFTGQIPNSTLNELQNDPDLQVAIMLDQSNKERRDELALGFDLTPRTPASSAPRSYRRVSPGKNTKLLLPYLTSRLQLTSENDLGFSIAQPDGPIIEYSETIETVETLGIVRRILEIRPVNDGEALLTFTFPPAADSTTGEPRTSTVRLKSGQQ